jgi:dienelactone hydrolase
LLALLQLDDLLQAPPGLLPKVLSSIPREGYTEHEIELQATPTRRFTARMTMPDGKGPFPAVVCIHGHGGTRASPYDAATVYRGFATELAKQGFVTIACDVGQHQVMESGRTLMGERFWDLRRCVDYLQTRGEVDQQRIGCGGLSLGGEMAMWLGALDERIAATVSCGFLTTMDQLEQGHCPCWKFDGLRQLVDWADVYALVAPRGLQCQNGLFEPPTDFCVPLARRAMAEIGRTYADRGAPLGCDLHVHAGGHVVDVPALVAFLQQQLARG